MDQRTLITTSNLQGIIYSATTSIKKKKWKKKFCNNILWQYKLNLHRGALTWSIEATIRIWVQAASRARYCWVSKSLNPGPSILWITTQTKQSSSSISTSPKNVRRSSMDWELNGCWLLAKSREEALRFVFIWSYSTSAKAIKTYSEKHWISGVSWGGQT